MQYNYLRLSNKWITMSKLKRKLTMNCNLGYLHDVTNRLGLIDESERSAVQCKTYLSLTTQKFLHNFDITSPTCDVCVERSD